MEDAATAEISRTQLWQWVRYGAKLDDERTITPELYRALRDEELDVMRERLGAERVALGHLDRAIAIFDALILDEQLADFLTLPAYDQLLAIESNEPVETPV
jgi:malate synthase